jgi:hypothetical protein
MSNTFNSAFSAMNLAPLVPQGYVPACHEAGYPSPVGYFYPPPNFPVTHAYAQRSFYTPTYNPAQQIPSAHLTQLVPPMPQMQPMQPMQPLRPVRQTTGQKFVPKSGRAKREDTLRPFAYASVRAFAYLHEKIMQSVKHLRDKERITVRGVDSKDMFEFTSTDGRAQKWALHTLMYGKMTGPNFTVRKNTHEEYGIISPFVAMQLVLLKQNLFLTNESDPRKSFALVLMIHRVAPDASVVPLWHGQNVMPTGQDDEIVLTNFYHASFSDAAIFVNQRIADLRASGNTEEFDEDFDAE